MNLQKEREMFEAWVGSNGRNIECFSNGSYKSMTLDKEWEAWQAAKAQAVPEGFVLVAKKSVEHWYLDEGECLWMDEPDNWLCDMDVGDVQEVKHKEYIATESNTLYATKVWDDENQEVNSWEFFNSKDDAEKAAEYCKAMIEA